MDNSPAPTAATGSQRSLIVPVRRTVKPPRSPFESASPTQLKVVAPAGQNSPAAQPSKNAALDSLTALRFVAALAIVFYHFKPVMPRFSAGLTSLAFLDRLSTGVEFFFVLSGFILFYNYGSRERLDLKEFYLKRLVRIYPLHLLTFTAWCVFFFSSWGCSLSDKLWSGLANVTLVQSLVPGFLFCLGYNAVSWSLSNEAFFYACFPVVRRKAVAVAVISAVAIYLVVMHMTGLQAAVGARFPNIEYFCPLIRIAEFCAGILAAQSFSPRAKLTNATLWEAAVILAVAFQISFQHVDYSLNQFSHLFVMTASVWIFAHQQGKISKWLARQQLLVLLGESSFSLYMWHHMILRGCNDYLPAGMWAPAALFLAAGTSILCSVLSFRYFENPCRRGLTALLLPSHAVFSAEPQNIELSVVHWSDSGEEIPSEQPLSRQRAA